MIETMLLFVFVGGFLFGVCLASPEKDTPVKSDAQGLQEFINKMQVKGGSNPQRLTWELLRRYKITRR